MILRKTLQRWALIAPVLLVAYGITVIFPSVAHADNTRLNDGVFSDIYTAQRRNNCTTEPRVNGRLVDAARRHAIDLLDHPDVNGDIGSDGSTPGERARDAGFAGEVAETIAVNPALAISGSEILNQWWRDPPSRATMQDCNNTAIGVWSVNSLARTIVVALYGQPSTTSSSER
ncbi:MAG: hypothetical protein QOF67_3303 [Mycobacterium sp.]|nr:hypothetical protein [Mycobacterium sp.]